MSIIYSYKEANAVFSADKRLQILKNYMKKENRKVITHVLIKALQDVGDIQNIYCTYEDTYATIHEVENKIHLWLNERDKIHILWNNKNLNLIKNKIFYEGKELQEINQQLINIKKDTMFFDIKIISIMLLKYFNKN